MRTNRTEYHRQWRDKNREKIREQRRKWAADNPDSVKASQQKYREANRDLIRTKYHKTKKAQVESSVESFLRKKLARIIDKENCCRESAKPKFQDCDLDLDYITDLWEAQNGRCALTNKAMTHKFNSLFAVSVDRIDSGKGYVKGNIQLVCQAINYAKNKFTNEQFLNFWNNQEETTCENEYL